MKIRVNTTEYIFSHGRKPRGYGYWAFQVGEIFPDAMVWFRGTYSEALKAAMKLAKERKVYEVKVMP